MIGTEHPRCVMAQLKLSVAGPAGVSGSLRSRRTDRCQRVLERRLLFFFARAAVFLAAPVVFFATDFFFDLRFFLRPRNGATLPQPQPHEWGCSVCQRG